MILYTDTSAVVKYYVKETGSEDVARLIDQADLIGFASVTYVEMASALSKAARMKWLTESDAKKAWEDYLSHWQSYTRLPISNASLERAGRLTWEYGLRTCDAIHLAAALAWKDALSENITIATYDRELWFAGQKAGLSMWPEQLE